MYRNAAGCGIQLRQLVRPDSSMSLEIDKRIDRIFKAYDVRGRVRGARHSDRRDPGSRCRGPKRAPRLAFRYLRYLLDLLEVE